MWWSDKWNDYELIDCGEGERLERWGQYILVRPDPQAVWDKTLDGARWGKFNGRYKRSQTGGGKWEIKKLPQSWSVKYDNLTFGIKPMGFKHTGVFPEQAANWEFIRDSIKSSGRDISALNLFAYTGGATIAAASAGASVCHVDAAKNMVAFAKNNASMSGLSTAHIRYIVDDCKKFVEREIRRGKKYDAIIMDPPSYGRGPSGEVWKIEDNIFELVQLAETLLSDNPLFLLLNSYSTGLSPAAGGYMVSRAISSKRGGRTESSELGIRVKSTGLILPAGAATRWIAQG